MQMTGMANEFNQKVVCVLGMHRSGTSALTRIVNLIGVYLGPQSSLAVEPAHDNEKGHWEHKEIVLINEAILKRYGGSWHEPPILPGGWETSPALNDLRNDARKLLEDQFANVALWGWKDPRTCLTLPFWQHLVSNIYYILCFRNPVDVSRSLEHRDSLPSETSFRIWLSYVTSALKNTEGKPRLIVFYEDMIEDPDAALDCLADFMDQADRARSPEVRDNLKEFIKKDLQHHSSPLPNADFTSTSERSAKALYLAQRISADLSVGRINEQLNDAFERLTGDRDGASSETNLKSLSKQLLERDDIVARLSAQLEEQARISASDAETAAANIRALSEQLLQTEKQLSAIKETIGFQLLKRCWRIKDVLIPPPR